MHTLLQPISTQSSLQLVIASRQMFNLSMVKVIFTLYFFSQGTGQVKLCSASVGGNNKQHFWKSDCLRESMLGG